MKCCLFLLSFALLSATQAFSQETLQKLFIETSDPPSVPKIYIKCGTDNGVIVFNTTIPALQFNIPDAPNRLKDVSYSKDDNCYVLCIQPTDTEIGGYTGYIIEIKGKNYIMERCSVSGIKSIQAQYFTIKSSFDSQQAKIQQLETELSKYKDAAIQQQKIENAQRQQRDFEKQQNQEQFSQQRETTEQSKQSAQDMYSNYKYKTTFNNNLPFNVPLRVEPNVNSREIYQCPSNAVVYVIDDSGNTFSKVFVNGYIGYLSKNTLQNVVKNSSYTNNSNSYNGSSSYKFQTAFDNPLFNVPLRMEPNVNSKEIYSCPKNSTVYIIDDSRTTFYKVRVDGHVGYVSKSLLKRN